MIEMAYKVLGQGHPIVVIHGLYGMSDNWIAFAKNMESRYKIYLVDVRNHGLSPHTETHTYNDICADMLLFFQNQNIEKATLLGHSMGGKAAMLFALRNPEKVSSLIVVDIAPVNYQEQKHCVQVQKHSDIINSMLEVNLLGFQNRSDIENKLNYSVRDIRTTRFLLKNLTKITNRFHWRLNLTVLQKSLANIVGWVDANNYVPVTSFPVLFLKGSESDYITAEGEKNIRRYFPFAKINTISDTGHWLHAEKPKEFFEAIISFLD